MSLKDAEGAQRRRSRRAGVLAQCGTHVRSAGRYADNVTLRQIDGRQNSAAV